MEGGGNDREDREMGIGKRRGGSWRGGRREKWRTV